MFPLRRSLTQAPAMKDLIRSPLQFVRSMTDDEWQELKLRAGHRERQRIKRHQPHAKAKPIEPTTRRRADDRLTRSASPAGL
jgi:hypothetical protein